MAIALYQEPRAGGKLSSTDLEYSPFTVTFDGRVGGAIVRQLYVRNDDLTRYYSDIRVSAVDSGVLNHVDGTNHRWEWKILQKDIVPSEAEWATIAPGVTVILSDDGNPVSLGSTAMGDISTYLSFWVRVAVPNQCPVQTIKTIVLRLTATEAMVTG